jgi:small subunit ribosomal protein S4
MAVYHGPGCKLCRREGQKLMLKGERCKSEKCAMEKRPYPPGLRMTKRRRSTSEYNTQLREKQKIKRIYGMLEKQFRLFFQRAAKQEGVTGENLLKMLECRLENVVYRMGFTPSRATARQLVLHNHFLVNGAKVNIPSYLVKEGDVVQVKEKSKTLELIHNALRAVREVPDWLQIDKVKLSGTVIKIPDRSSIPTDIQERLVVELYSK